MKFFWILFILIGSLQESFSQYNFGNELLQRNGSASIIAIGGSGVGLPIEGVSSLIYNPAQTGMNSINNNISVSYNYNTNQILLFDVNDQELKRYDMPDKNTGFSLGYCMDSIVNLPFNLGLSFINRNRSLDNIKITDYDEQISIVNVMNSSNEITLSGAFRYSAIFSFGLTYKFINYESGQTFKNVNYKTNANTSAFDIGFLIKIPTIQNYKIFDKVEADFDISMGTALLNVGEDISGEHFRQPLPKQFSVGYGLALGFKYTSNYFQIKCLNIDWTASTDSKLTVANTFSSTKQKEIFEDLNIFDNLFGMQNSEFVKSNHGFSFAFFETFTYSFGSGYFYVNDVNTKGIEIKSRGLSKLLYYITDAKLFKNIYEHANLTFASSNIKKVVISASQGFYYPDINWTGLNLSVKL